MKPGIRSTEFWLTVGIIALAIAGSLAEIVPSGWAVKVSGIAGALYAVLRTVLKLTGHGAAVDISAQVRDAVRTELKTALAKPATAAPPAYAVRTTTRPAP
jgi:hypothetical protein